eukprot:5508630-Prymnesium_polylepis.1
MDKPVEKFGETPYTAHERYVPTACCKKSAAFRVSSTLQCTVDNGSRTRPSWSRCGVRVAFDTVLSTVAAS